MLTWAALVARHPAGHLVMGVHPTDTINRVKLLQRLIKAMPAAGDWAVRASFHRGERVVLAGFEKEADAVRLGETFGARRGMSSRGWNSRRVFGFPADMAKKVEQLLASA
jgi:hypothetical protein